MNIHRILVERFMEILNNRALIKIRIVLYTRFYLCLTRFSKEYRWHSWKCLRQFWVIKVNLRGRLFYISRDVATFREMGILLAERTLILVMCRQLCIRDWNIIVRGRALFSRYPCKCTYMHVQRCLLFSRIG